MGCWYSHQLPQWKYRRSCSTAFQGCMRTWLIFSSMCGSQCDAKLTPEKWADEHVDMAQFKPTRKRVDEQIQSSQVHIAQVLRSSRSIGVLYRLSTKIVMAASPIGGFYAGTTAQLCIIIPNRDHKKYTGKKICEHPKRASQHLGSQIIRQNSCSTDPNSGLPRLVVVSRIPLGMARCVAAVDNNCQWLLIGLTTYY